MLEELPTRRRESKRRSLVIVRGQKCKTRSPENIHRGTARNGSAIIIADCFGDRVGSVVQIIMLRRERRRVRCGIWQDIGCRSIPPVDGIPQLIKGPRIARSVRKGHSRTRYRRLDVAVKTGEAFETVTFWEFDV